MPIQTGNHWGWHSLAAILALTIASNAPAATHYVDANGINPVSPYTDWSTAATNIQDAVDASTNGDLILVNDGVYTPVSVAKPIAVQSVNGPAATAVDGGGEQTCAYLANGTSLAGFTLTNGYTDYKGGGVFCESTDAVVSNCVFVANYAYSEGGGAFGGTLFNCTFVSNSVYSSGGGGAAESVLMGCTLTGNVMLAEGGGGAYRCSLNSCTLSNNIGAWSGGADQCTLTNCLLVGNHSDYYGGGAGECDLNNCLLVSNSADGVGGGAARSTLINCTLTKNSSSSDGGGAADSLLNNCTLAFNSAGGTGGGASFGFFYGSAPYLYNCILTNNTAVSDGGGVESGYAVNCTIVNNFAGGSGGGADLSELHNCIVYFNTASSNANYSPDNCVFNYSCTTPLPNDGLGNFAADPLLVNVAGGNLHLQSHSPCINAGNNSSVTNESYSIILTTDFEGNPRIVGGTVDLGAYEFQSPASLLSYAWLQHYGLTTDGSADFLNPDGDGLNNWQEWRAQTDPTDASSILRMLSPAPTNNVSGLTVTWQSVNGVNYFLQRSANLAAQPAFISIESNLVGQAGTTSYTDATATNAGPYFYQVGVQ